MIGQNKIMMNQKMTQGENFRIFWPISRISGFSFSNDCSSMLKMQIDATLDVKRLQMILASNDCRSFFASPSAMCFNSLFTTSLTDGSNWG
jgi:hypothetical protein